MERVATVERKTRETEISLTLNLDGKGECGVKNPIGFFNHMLSSFCKHGLFDLSGTLSGDLNVDEHHLIEDTGIALGECFAKALGDERGIARSGCFAFPMDETLACAAVDFGGRPFCVVNADLSGVPLVSTDETGRESLFQTACFEDFWQGFASGAKCNIHLDVIRGRSDHHKMEALFKAAAKAISEAVRRENRRGGQIPSTKGVII